MPCFTAPIDGNGQLIVTSWVTDVSLSMDMNKIDEAIAGNSVEKLAGLGIICCHSLLDTGANKSCITERLAESLNLTIQGSNQIHSVSESTTANLYRVNIHIPFSRATVQGSRMIADWELRNWRDVKVIGISSTVQAYDLLLGIDFIRQGALHVSDKNFTFCI